MSLHSCVSPPNSESRTQTRVFWNTTQLHQIQISFTCPIPSLPYRYRCHFLLFITVVIACLTTTPALSTSFFDKPVVTQTFRAGCGRHSLMRSLGVAPIARGMALRRVMRTPFVRACRIWSVNISTEKQSQDSPHQRNLAAAFPARARCSCALEHAHSSTQAA